jgi:hypothetical protein
MQLPEKYKENFDVSRPFVAGTQSMAVYFVF